MGLSQSLYTGYSGLVTHQRAMDNTANNLANVNTIGYKNSSFMFSDLMKQTITGSLPADGDTGSTSGKTLGLGVTTGSILNNFAQGGVELSDDPLSCYISGNGFFVVNTTRGTALTRNGDFWLDNSDSNGQRMLVVGDGLQVQGWNATNGVISLSNTVSNIYLPAQGDLLAGKVTSSVSIGGVLPTDTTTTDFSGTTTTQLELKGNLNSNGQTLNTSIYSTVTQTDANGNYLSESVVEIPVTITFSGPTASDDGSANQWTWTMSTVDYPNTGDSVQIYPADGDTEFTQGTISFSTTSANGIGQAVANTIKPGSTSVSTTSDDGVTTSFSLSSGFTLDVSRLTNMASAPGGNALETWYVNGNPTGTMLRTVTVLDEYTDFEENENGTMTAVRTVGERQASVILGISDQDSSGTTWSWISSLEGTAGTMRFNTQGELTSTTQSGGSVQFNWDGVVFTALDGSLNLTSQDGYVDGALQDLSIDDNGIIWGFYDNNEYVMLAQIAMGNVTNLNGLSGSSGTLFYATSASGAINYGVANDSSGGVLASSGLGSIISGGLESSNVNLNSEFSNLISYERGYQFNSRIVTTANEMLQTAIQLKQ